MDYTLGPLVEVELPHGLSAEADLLYKRLGFPESRSAGRWELPVLLKYRLTEKRIAPFFEAGASFNRITGPGVLQDAGAELRHRGAKGAIAGAGLQIRAGAFRITPEFRFTRWVDRNLGVRDAALRSNLSQAELLVGLAFQP